jgi:hypothetical protein
MNLIFTNSSMGCEMYYIGISDLSPNFGGHGVTALPDGLRWWHKNHRRPVRAREHCPHNNISIAPDGAS